MTQHKQHLQGTIPVTSKQTGKTIQHQQPVKQKPSVQYQPEKLQNNLDGNDTKNTKNKPEIKELQSTVVNKEEKSTQKPVKDKKTDPESIEDFIKYFYFGKIKSLPEKLARKLNDKIITTSITSPEIIKDCLGRDNSLEKTKLLLLLTLHQKRFPKIEKTLRDAAQKIIYAHPEMQDQHIDHWFPAYGANQTKDISEIWFDLIVKSQKNEVELSNDNLEKEAVDKKNLAVDSHKSRRNAFVAVAVWRFSERFMSFPDLIRELRSTILPPPNTKEEIEIKSLECLVASQDGRECDRVGALIKWFSDQLDNLRNQMEQHRRKADALQELLEKNKDLITTKELELSKLELELSDLRVQLVAAHENTRVQGIHFRDDQQKQRGRTLRALEEEVPMLQDTLKALERDPPKINVAKDYLARVLDNLNNELKQLQGN